MAEPNQGVAEIELELVGHTYRVLVGANLLTNAGALMRPFLSQPIVPIVADAAARRFHGDRLDRSLQDAGYETRWHELPPGEGAKSWNQLEKLIDWLLELGIGRKDRIVAFGGGVTGDLTGFAASILKRGCGFIQIPTTLLAQVDSSVGGKTAINTPAGKNLVGAFHQPSLVLADLGTLGTLPARELRAGYAEVLKYGVLGDAEFFDWLSSNGTNVLALDPQALEHAVATSVAAKARIVAEDERETSGSRALLNLGHTFGHALEAETGFSDRLLHGEAVALGMVLAARYSARRGEFSLDEAARVTKAVDAAGLPSEIAALGMDCDGATLRDHMLHDKKMDAGTLPFILLRSIGEAYLAKDVDLADIAAFLDEELQAH